MVYHWSGVALVWSTYGLELDGGWCWSEGFRIRDGEIHVDMVWSSMDVGEISG